MNTSVSYESNLIQRLRDDPSFAQIYLEEAMMDTDTPDGKALLLTVLRQLAEAQGGMSHLAENSGLKREALYRALSPKGNPTLTTLMTVLNALGLRLSLAHSQTVAS